MSIREGSPLLDPTRCLSPAGAKRARERFTKIIESSEERIRDLRARRVEITSRIDEKIMKEQNYIQEARLVLDMLEEAWGPDYDGQEVDPDTVEVIKRVEAEGDDYEIVLYGTPCF